MALVRISFFRRSKSVMQRFFSYTLIVVMSLSVVIPTAIPFYEICRNQLTGAVMEDLVEEGFAEIEKETYTYTPPGTDWAGDRTGTAGYVYFPLQHPSCLPVSSRAGGCATGVLLIFRASAGAVHLYFLFHPFCTKTYTSWSFRRGSRSVIPPKYTQICDLTHHTSGLTFSRAW